MSFELLKIQQEEFLKKGNLLSIDYRIEQLNLLKKGIQSLENEIIEALHLDFGKSEFEAYSSEVGFIYQDINETIKNIKKWAKPQRMSTALSLFPSSAKIYSQAYGRVLIIAPWNYPFQLLIAPLVAAISAGNAALLKPSELTPKVSAVLKKLIENTFKPEFVAIVEGEGGEIVPNAIENYRPDLIFFTGSTVVGRIISQQAAKYLIPCVLELGGKSPCIIDQSADLKVAVKRIAFGKCINAGQTCVAPDYFIVHDSIKKSFIEEYQKTVSEFYAGDAFESSDFTQIVNERHFERLERLLQNTNILTGGRVNREKRKIEPTLVDGDLNHPIMQEEIFGPISPVFTFTKESEIYDLIEKNKNPLSLYLFTKDSDLEKNIIERVSFGGGCINNTLMHLVDPKLPFGGIGNSGQGAYHGKAGFDAFSHKKSVVKTATWFDLKQKYPPYTEGSLKLIKKFL